MSRTSPRAPLVNPAPDGRHPDGIAYSSPIRQGVEARRVIAYWASEGATWVKFLGAETRDVLAAGITEAHARGLKVTGHLCSVTFSEAAALGIDLLQHGFITNSDYVPNKAPDVCPPENMRAQADVDVNSAAVQTNIRELVSRRAAVASTLAVYETFIPERARLDSAAMAMLAPAARSEVEANHAALAQSGYTVPVRLLKKMMEWERAFVRAGGLLGALVKAVEGKLGHQIDRFGIGIQRRLVELDVTLDVAADAPKAGRHHRQRALAVLDRAVHRYTLGLRSTRHERRQNRGADQDFPHLAILRKVNLLL